MSKGVKHQEEEKQSSSSDSDSSSSSSISSSSESQKSDETDGIDKATKKMLKKMAEKLSRSIEVDQLKALSQKKGRFASLFAKNFDKKRCTSDPAKPSSSKYPDSSKPGPSKVSDSGKPRSSNHSKSQKCETKRRRLKKKQLFKPRPFTGDKFRVKGDNDGTALREGCNIRCMTKNFKTASESGSAGVAVRHLMDGVFSDDALATCSLTGMPPRGMGHDFYNRKDTRNKIKPFIDQKAIDEIVELALRWQQERHWRSKRDERYLRQQISVKLCEKSRPPDSDSKDTSDSSDNHCSAKKGKAKTAKEAAGKTASDNNKSSDSDSDSSAKRVKKAKKSKKIKKAADKEAGAKSYSSSDTSSRDTDDSGKKAKKAKKGKKSKKVKKAADMEAVAKNDSGEDREAFSDKE